MNMITCSTDCAYQKDGYCCLDFVSEITGSAVAGCHYYKKVAINLKEAKKAVPDREVIPNRDGIF